MSKIKCEICGREIAFTRLGAHVRKEHEIDPKEYYDKYLKKDGEGSCKNCGKPTKFIRFTKGYRDCCCAECTNLIKYGYKYHTSRPEVQAKIQKTNIERYGAKTPFESKKVQDEIKESNLEKYGSVTPFGDEKVQEKIHQTNIERFGAKTPFESKEIQDKVKQTMIDKYGVDNAFKSEEVQNKIKETTFKNYGVNHNWKSKEVREKGLKTLQKSISDYCKENNLIELRELDLVYPRKVCEKFKINVLAFKKVYLIDSNTNIQELKEYDKYLQDNAKEYNSKYEAELHAWLKSIYDGEIHVNTRKIITPLELDFYIPDKKLAIEFNGNWCHSINFGIDKNYHLNKTLLCQEKGMHLIHIFEYEWNLKKDICKSIISSALGIYENKIYARECEIREVSSKEAKEFLEENHLQGFTPSNYRIGLYFNNELVQLLCFGKNRFKNNEIELLRMCTKLNTQVVGGFSKLLTHQPYDYFTSYVDLSKFSAEGYLSNNFKIIGKSGLNYKYIKDERVLNRFAAQKHKLPKLLGDTFDATKTESQNMIDNDWWQVYDCGNLKLLYSRN